MEAALPGEEIAAASALVSMNTSPAAAPRPAALVLEAEVPLPAQVLVSCMCHSSYVSTFVFFCIVFSQSSM